MCSPTGPAAPASAASSPEGTPSVAELFAPGMPEPALSPHLAAEDASGAAEMLAGLCREFPDFRIWREITGDRTRYIARSLHPGTGPHTVITAELGELREVLRDACAPQQPGASGPQ